MVSHSKESITIAYYLAPLGLLILEANSDSLISVKFDSTIHVKNNEPLRHSLLKEAIQQLRSYFQKKLFSFDLPLAPEGTHFQLAAWTELRKIPYGQTISYSEQANRLGDPQKARAVGMANKRNPLSIMIPCHRVIGKNGTLNGYQGTHPQGLQRKEFLLQLEKRR